MKNKEKETIRRTFKAPVQLDGAATEKILFLSRCLIQLWNLAVEQAELWLETKERPVSAFSFNFWLTPMREKTIELEDGTEVRLDTISSDAEREMLRKLAGFVPIFLRAEEEQGLQGAEAEAEKKPS